MDLNSLNAEQRKAVETTDGPVLILAGPGTGKTKTLTARIAYLLESQKVAATDIVALTFTTKAAHEMRVRLQALLGPSAKLPTIVTFHALGHALLKQHGVAKPLITEQDRMEIIRHLDKPAQLKKQNPRALSLLLSKAKTAVQTPMDAGLRQLLAQYQAELVRKNVFDFDDLLTKTYELLQSKPGLRPGYQYVHVDEFQDTSDLQYELLKLLGNADNIFAIGDPNQSIYAFRGAGMAVLEQFRADFPDTREVNLVTNYRSCPEIIALANAVFPKGPQLEAHRQDDGRVQLTQTLNEYSEADYIVGEIERGIGGSDMLKAHTDDSARQPRDYAVLYRTHRAGRGVQKAFEDSGLPYQVAGEDSPYNRPDIQAVIASLHYLHEPDDASLSVLPDLSRNQLKALLGSITSSSVSDKAAGIIGALGLQANPHTQQFIGMLVQFGDDLAAALKHLDDISENDFYDPSVNAVTLLTIHASKGLEFEHIFLCAAEESILPKLNTKGEGNIDEERRLFYVAVTRAKEVLEILYTKKRYSEPAKLSRFVKALPVEILPHRIDPAMNALEKRLHKRQQKRAQTNLF